MKGYIIMIVTALATAIGILALMAKPDGTEPIDYEMSAETYLADSSICNALDIRI